MKKNTLLSLSLLFTLLLSLFACRKSIEFYVDGKEAPATSLLESAKIWRSQRLDNITPKNQVLKAYWNDAWTVVTSNGDEMVVVPAPERKMTDKNITIRRFLVFTGKGNIVSNGNIVEFVAEKSDVTKQLNILLPNIHQQSVSNFNGFMSSYDINYRFLHSSNYKNGAKTKLESKIATASSKLALKDQLNAITIRNDNKRVSYIGGRTNSTQSSSAQCEPIMPITVNLPHDICPDALITWRIDWTKDGNGCLTSLFYNYSTHVCTNGAGTGDSGSGDGSGSGSGSSECPDGECSGSGGYTGGGNPNYGGPGSTAPTLVYNLVNDPCLKSAVNTSLNATNEIKNMLYNTFGYNGGTPLLDYDLSFYDVTNLPDTIAAATSADNQYLQKIELNKNILLNRSKEYIVSTIYHEVIHAYLNVNYLRDTTNKYAIPDHHEEMMDNYLDLLTSALMSAFPDLEEQEAWALSMDGLKDTTYYSKKTNILQRTFIDNTLSTHFKSANISTRQGSYCN